MSIFDDDWFAEENEKEESILDGIISKKLGDKQTKLIESFKVKSNDELLVLRYDRLDGCGIFTNRVIIKAFDNELKRRELL